MLMLLGILITKTHMSEISATSNGHEIGRPTPIATAEALKARLSSEYGIDGNSPAERVEQLKQLSVEGVAIMLEDINKSVQGSADSLVSHDRVIKIGGKETIKLEDRYDVFTKLVTDIQNAPEDVNPARVGDVLALGVVALHPFQDGNGRTARTIGLLFRDSYDESTYQEDYDVAIEPRDKARERGGFVISGYIPRYPEGFDQSDAASVSGYLEGLLHHENPGAYLSCFGQAPLHLPAERAAE